MEDKLLGVTRDDRQVMKMIFEEGTEKPASRCFGMELMEQRSRMDRSLARS